MKEYGGIWRNMEEYGGIWRNNEGIWRNMKEYEGIWRNMKYNMEEYGGIWRNNEGIWRNMKEYGGIMKKGWAMLTISGWEYPSLRWFDRVLLASCRKTNGNGFSASSVLQAVTWSLFRSWSLCLITSKCVPPGLFFWTLYDIIWHY